MNFTCNSTLEDLRILPTSEVTIVGPLTFHELALIIAGACTLIAIVMSFYLMFMHATHYTKPREQKHIIRILFMVPVYAVAAFLSLRFYWHAIYYQVISDCYEAFAISSFFALMCHYMAPDLHEQKQYFRHMRPIKPWVWPLTWMNKCCGGERGPWRTPKSGLTWFNIIWIGIYHYCFIRVAMTITAVVTQYFDRYCESSNNPVFGHIWVIVIESVAVTIAMFCVIQFYIQLRGPLAEHQPFLKVLAIKLVIFLSFWQSAAISVGTSTLNIVHPNSVLAYPDIKVGLPSLLLCFEMACFSILHLWAFPYRPYLDNAKVTYYPVAGGPDGGGAAPKENEHFPRAGGFLGLRAILDAANIWDVVKAFGRGIRWLFVGVKHRHEDESYHETGKNSETASTAAGADHYGSYGMDDLSGDPSKLGYGGGAAAAAAQAKQHGRGKSTDHLPIASQFRRSMYDMKYGYQQYDSANGGAAGPGGAGRGGDGPGADSGRRYNRGDESAALIAHAQPNPSSPYRDARTRPPQAYAGDDGAAQASLSTVDEEQRYSYDERHHHQPRTAQNPAQYQVGRALWGGGGQQHPLDGGAAYQTGLVGEAR